MENFANTNYMALYKIFKKHDKKAPAEAVKLLPQLEHLDEEESNEDRLQTIGAKCHRREPF